MADGVVCRHGGLRRVCEPCELAERLKQDTAHERAVFAVLRMSLSWVPADRCDNVVAALEYLHAALQQARQERDEERAEVTAWMLAARSRYEAAEAQLAAQDAALQGLEQTWQTFALEIRAALDPTEDFTDMALADIFDRHAKQLASVRAARGKET